MPSPWALGAAYLSCVLIWGTTWAAIRFSLESFPPFLGASLRFALAAVLLLAYARIRGVRLGREPQEQRLWWINGLLSFAATYGIVYWAEQWVPSGLASVLFATFPMFVAVLAHFFLPGERLAPLGSGGVLLGFVGVAVIFSEDLAALGGAELSLAAWVLLLSPVAAALGSVAAKRWGRGLPALSLSGPPMAIGAVILGMIGALVERSAVWPADPSWQPTGASVVAMLYLGVVGSALVFGLYFWLLQHLTATRTSLIAYLSPVVAVAVGTLFLGEPLTPRLVLGALVVLVGTALASQAKAR
jgi:drug/metabolite transporter (DMT)-like permease